MKSIKFISIITITLFAFSSCSDFLEKTPHTLTPETYFNTESELQQFLTGVYSPLMQNFFYGNYYPVYVAGGDDLSFYQRNTAVNSIICNNANSSNENITTFWRVLYEGINRANMLLENADKNPDIPQAVRDRIKAEALFLRSFYYFNLVQGWGDVPLRLTSTQSVDGLSLPRTSKQIIYNQIIEDIIKSIPNLRAADASSAMPGIVTQSAAQGILARIYLYRAGENYRDLAVGLPQTNTADSITAYFTHARDWALKVKSNGLHGLVSSYKTVFSDLCSDQYNSTGVRESIWEVEEAGARVASDQASGRIGNTIGFGATNDYSTIPDIKTQTGMANPGYSYKFIYASLKLFRMYEAEGDTARGNWNIADYEYTYASTTNKEVTGRKYYYGKKPLGLVIPGYTITEDTKSTSDANKTRCAAKYRRESELVTPKNKNWTPINFPVLRYSDILLMIAEADNELTSTPSDLAYECLDAVRVRAHISAMTGNGLTKEQFREIVKNERAMEFCFEATRRWDLIRWGEFYTTMNAMDGMVSDAQWGSAYKYVQTNGYYKVSKAYNYFPIPDMEISVNNAINQNNPGW